MKLRLFFYALRVNVLFALSVGWLVWQYTRSGRLDLIVFAVVLICGYNVGRMLKFVWDGEWRNV